MPKGKAAAAAVEPEYPRADLADAENAKDLDRYAIYAEYVAEQTGLDIAPEDLRAAVVLYQGFQRSELNREFNEQRKLANAEGREARRAAYEEKRAEAARKKEEREEARTAREEERAAKAAEKEKRAASRKAKAAEAPAKAQPAAKKASAPAKAAKGNVTPIKAPKKGARKGGKPTAEQPF